MIVTDNLPLTILRRREGFRKFVKVRQIKYVFIYSSPPYCSIACFPVVQNTLTLAHEEHYDSLNEESNLRKKGEIYQEFNHCIHGY
jgi:hypothetical protein